VKTPPDWLPPTPAEPTDRVLARRDDADAFRAEIRAWIAERLPSDWLDRLRGAEPGTYVAFQRWWFAEMTSVGLGTPHWPAEAGGVALPLSHQVIFYEELARAEAPSPVLYAFSIYHLPATLLFAGTPAQRERYLPGVRERGDVWCQGFSEPNAGSDLASLRTRAEKVEGGYRVNGQKIWSSNAADADYCLLLARTDPAAAKHMGISYFILDMRAPGVDVRPIAQANGEREFNEVFLDDVFIPDESLIGAEGEGWRIAQETLAAERGVIIFELAERMRLVMDRKLSEARTQRPPWWRDDGLRREFITLYAEMRAVQRMIRLGMEGKGGDFIAATVKVTYAEVLQRYTDWVVRTQGLSAQFAAPLALGTGRHGEMPMPDYVSSYIWTISGGANEILKNVIAERALDLPREPVAAARGV
jgi:alkylation response protein AidB-like acyl-CoA dehydrogenase